MFSVLDSHVESLRPLHLTILGKRFEYPLLRFWSDVASERLLPYRFRLRDWVVGF